MTMQWTTRDPLEFGGGQSNLYEYAGNNPTNNTDPSGELWGLALSLGGAISGAIGGAIAGSAFEIAGQLANGTSWSDLNWKNVAAAGAGGAVSGGIWGAAVGGLASGDPLGMIVGGAALGFVSGAAGGFTESAVKQYLNNEDGSVDWNQARRDAQAPAVAGGILGAFLGPLAGIGKMLPPTGLVPVLDGSALRLASAGAPALESLASAAGPPVLGASVAMTGQGQGNDESPAAKEQATESSGAKKAEAEAMAAEGGGSNAPRPSIPTNLPDEVTQELAPGMERTGKLLERTRNFASRYIEDARGWWEARTGEKWPLHADPAKAALGELQWAEHPRSLAKGGDPLFVEPGKGTSRVAPHVANGESSEFGRRPPAPGNRPRGRPPKGTPPTPTRPPGRPPKSPPAQPSQPSLFPDPSGP